MFGSKAEITRLETIKDELDHKLISIETRLENVEKQDSTPCVSEWSDQVHEFIQLERNSTSIFDKNQDLKLLKSSTTNLGGK